MTTILAIIGVLLVLFGIVSIIAGLLIDTNERVENEGTMHERKVSAPGITQLLNVKFGIVALLIATGVFTLKSSIYYAERGVYYEIIYPNGSKSAEFNEGYHVVTPFTKVNPWKANLDVKAGDLEKMSDKIEGKVGPIEVTFLDQVGADIEATYKFTLPRDEKKFLAMCIKHGSVENLVETILIPTALEQAKLSSKMFSVQDYISGAAQEFRVTFEENLKGGTYKVSKITTKDTTYNQITTGGPREIKDILVTYSVEKVLDKKTGLAIRIPNEISDGGIIVSSVIIDKVGIDPKYKQRLIAQKKESAKRQLEQQKIETAKVSQQRIRAEGERDKASEAAKQEIAQVKELIAIETSLKKESTNLKLAEIQLQTERKLSDKKKVKADAEAYEIRKKVAAGITPERRLEMNNERDVQIAKAYAKMATPSVVINNSGSGKGSSDLTNSLIQAEMAKKLINKKVTK